eukprot:Ihof_evm1s592 gene=Ihof_evmTU1s592
MSEQGGPLPPEIKLPSLRQNGHLLVGTGKPREILFMERLWESCPSKMALSYVMGLGLGGIFGIIGGSFEPIENQGARARDVIRDMGKRSWKLGKNFALVGGLFAGSE